MRIANSKGKPISAADSKETLSYEDWRDSISRVLIALIGIGLDDLEDICDRDMYDNGDTVMDVVDYVKEEFDLEGII